MNLKCVILLILLTFLILGTVNAQDNATSDEPVQNANPSDINVTFNEKMWEENLSNINVEVPEGTQGNFTVKINDEVIYNETITTPSFAVPIKIPKYNMELISNIYPPIDVREYKISAFLNDIDLNVTKTLKVMKFAPDVDYTHFPEEILQHSKNPVMVMFPRSANGTVEFYIDNRLAKRANAQPIIYWEDDTFSKLELGNHTLRVIYYGDDYYLPFNRTFDFLQTNVLISIPKIINISHDDCISVETLENVVGTVKVYIDNGLVYTSKTENGDFILSLEPYIKADSREVKVVYENRDFSRTKNQPISMVYDFDIYSLPFTYGEKNVVEIMLPDTLNNNLLTVTVNGVKCSFSHPEYIMNNIVEVDVSGLPAGNHSMLVSYAGDARFKAKSKTYNFTIDYGIVTSSFDIPYKDSSKVYLKLPKDADGSLVVYADTGLVKSTRLINGYAEVFIDMLGPGNHIIDASYTGSDYNISKITAGVYVEPKIILDYRFTAGENKYIAIEVPKDTKGYVVFGIDGVSHKVNIKNGIAKYSLSKLNPGEHEINIAYSGCDMSIWRIVTVFKPKIKILSVDLTYKSAVIKVKLLNKNGKPMAAKKVTIILNNKKYKVKTDKKGIAILKRPVSLKTKKSKIRVTFMGAKATKKAKVKAIFLKVSKNSKKLTVKASVKNPTAKRITVKVNKRTFSVRINVKGIAKLTIKKPNTANIRVQATYQKDNVKVTV